MMRTLPPMIQTMTLCYHGMIDNAIDNLTEEKIDYILSEAKAIINKLECNE